MNIVVAGDFSPMNRVEKLLEFDNYNIDTSGWLSKDDLFIINFESVITNNERNKIEKEGPHLCCTSKSAFFLKENGICAVTLANNHTMDYGEECLRNTIEHFQKCGIKVVGAGMTKNDAKQILYLEQNDEKVAIINCCEHEFSYAEEDKAGTNALDPIQQFYSIQDAKSKANYVVVIVHGGHEFFNLPSPRMIQTYRFFVDAGADAVVNHHQHCYSGFEYYKNKPIYYGLGNFCFDWPGRVPSFYTGYCVRIHLDKSITSEELPYTQCVNEPFVKFGEFEGFRADLDRLNAIIQSPVQLKIEIEKLFKSLKNECKAALTPFGNHYSIALVRRGYLPALVSKKKVLLWKGFIDCETHRDTMLYYLKNQINKG